MLFLFKKVKVCGNFKTIEKICQWYIAQLVGRSLSVMKDPGSNLGADICLFGY
jgi:hypothetical protein